jgi:hypothetical protein
MPRRIDSDFSVDDLLEIEVWIGGLVVEATEPLLAAELGGNERNLHGEIETIVGKGAFGSRLLEVDGSPHQRRG